MTLHFRVTFFTALLSCSAAACFAADPPAAESAWPQWRGPTRDGKVAGPAWPATINEQSLQRRWRVELGESYASPIVTPDLIFTVETKDRQREIVRALDRATGRQKWELAWDGAMTVPFFAARNGNWVRATPAWDGRRLYVAGMRDVLVCIDGASGAQVWRVDFTERYKAPLPAFGFVCSPLVVDDAVYVQAGASFVKLNKDTGETIWRAMADEGGMYGSAFSSPVMATIQGKPHLLVQTRNHLAGVDPKTGKELWKQKTEAFRGMNILTPTAFDNTVLISAYGGRTQQFKIDLAPAAPRAADGRSDETWTATAAWENRLQGYMTSPVVIDQHAYLLLRNKRFACVSLAGGDIKWVSEKSYSEYWSLVTQGDRILGLDQRGILYLIKANPERFELLEERKVSDQETWAHLAVAGGELFIRELNAMSAWDWKSPR